jgi:hypothetical protein
MTEALLIAMCIATAVFLVSNMVLLLLDKNIEWGL